MKVLIIDTSYIDFSSVCVFLGSESLCFHISTNEPLFWDLLKTSIDIKNIDLETLEAVAVSIGPGPFTSLRNGISIARTLSQILNIRIVAFSLIDVVYDNFYPLKPNILFDGRAGKFILKRPESENIEIVSVGDIYESISEKNITVSVGCSNLVSKTAINLINFDYLPMSYIINTVLRKIERDEFRNYNEVLPIYYKNY
ncbi:MAG: hypothetical protein N2712_03645 [Brevinematales bacterium]|nr:hypothetical protein [Brevinematales bacterium]